MHDPNHLKDQLTEFIKGRVCLLGIGNRYWRDDGIGSYVAEALESCQGLDVIDAGFIPENHLETVARKNPDSILMVDATDFGAEPGQARLLYPDNVTYSGVSTHAGSLRMLAKYLHARTQASIALLAIQPADIGEGEGLSPVVANTLEQLVDTLVDICNVEYAGTPRHKDHCRRSTVSQLKFDDKAP
jgi:hydrogenase 3 maturation protease